MIPRSIVLHCVLVMGLLGCGPEIPTLKNRPRVEKIFAAHGNRVWAASLLAVDSLGGTVLTQDRDSGLVVFAVVSDDVDGDVYVNVFMDEIDKDKTFVYVYPRAKGVNEIVDSVSRRFFDALDDAMGESSP